MHSLLTKLHSICKITRNDFICNFKKGIVIGSESEKVCKQVSDQIVWKKVEDAAQGQGCYRMEINSKAFAIPILTAFSL